MKNSFIRWKNLKIVFNEEFQGDDNEESSTLISPEVTPVITELVELFFVTTEFTVVSLKDNTLIFPKLIHVFTGIVEVL